MLLYVDSRYISPYAMSAFVALHEKALTFEIITLDLAAGEHRDSKHLKNSLTARVPTLVDGEFILSESSAIAEYIDETYAGTPLYPSESKTKAHARQIQACLRSDLMPIRLERSTEVLFYQPKSQPLSEAAKMAAKKLFTVADALLSQQQDYLFDEWSIADVDFAVMLNRLAFNGDDIPNHLAAYAKHQWKRPSVQLWVNQVRPPL